MAKESQKDFLRRLLRERGEAGVGAHELTYQHGITRAAAIVHTLRQEGLPIETKQETGHQAVYVLRAGQKVKPQPPPVPEQGGLLPDEDIPTVTWEQLGQAFAEGRRSLRIDVSRGSH